MEFDQLEQDSMSWELIVIIIICIVFVGFLSYKYGYLIKELLVKIVRTVRGGNNGLEQFSLSDREMIRSRKCEFMAAYEEYKIKSDSVWKELLNQLKNYENLPKISKDELVKKVGKYINREVILISYLNIWAEKEFVKFNHHPMDPIINHSTDDVLDIMLKDIIRSYNRYYTSIKPIYNIHKSEYLINDAKQLFESCGVNLLNSSDTKLELITKVDFKSIENNILGSFV